VKAHPLIAYRN